MKDIVTASFATVVIAACGAAEVVDVADTETVDDTTTAVPAAHAECAQPSPVWVWCDDFEENRLDDYFEVNDAGGSFVRTSGVGVEGSYGMKAAWTAGQVSAGALHLAVGRSPDGYRASVGPAGEDLRKLHWRVYVKNQEGWTGGGGDKLSRAFIFHSPDNWGQAMIAHVWSSGANNEHLAIDPASGTDEGGLIQTSTYNDFPNLRWLGLVRSSTPVFDDDHVGAWYCVEAEASLNDPDSANGTFRLWIDDHLEAERTDLNWVGSYDDYGLNAVFLENYWNEGAPVAQERYFDNFVVSTERIGCL